MKLKNFLKGDERVDKIARYVAEHYVKDESGDPFQVAMADRAKQVQESYEDR